jgi:hypothetical protein
LEETIMRLFGWILGGLYVADGVIAFIGGRRMMNWSYEKFGGKVPKPVSHIMKQGAHMDRGVYTAWGINNVLAGMGMLALTLLAQRRPAQT